MRSLRFARMRVAVSLLTAAAMVAPAAVPAAAIVPTVTRISGGVALDAAGGTTRTILSTQRTGEGDRITTKPDGLADVTFADVGRARIGHASTAQVQQTAGDLAMRLVSGTMCVSVDRAAITLAVGNLSIASTATPAVFGVATAPNGTASVVVYQGTVRSVGSGTGLNEAAGDAFSLGGDGTATLVPFDGAQSRFAGIGCPDAATLAQAKKLAEHPPAIVADGAPSGGGGGGGAVLGVLAGVGLLAAAAGGGKGGGGSSTPPVVVTPSPVPGLSVTPSVLTFGSPSSAAQAFTVSGGIGPYSESDSCAGKAAVTFSGAQGSVQPQGPGSCAVTVTDSASPVHSQTINVFINSSLVVQPNGLVFDPGSTASQQALVSGGSSPYSVAPGASSPCPSQDFSIAGGTITVKSTGIQPNSTCTIAVSDSAGNSATLGVTVNPVPQIVLAPTALTFANAQAPAQQVAINTGNPPFSMPTTACAPSGTGSATATASLQGTTVTVTPQSGGTSPCTLTVTDAANKSATITVSVYPPVVAAPAQLTFLYPNSGPQSAAISGGNETYKLGTIAGPCGPATKLAASTLTVTPTGLPQGAKCTIAIVDGVGNTASVTVGVGNYTDFTIAPPTLAFANPSDTKPPVNVSGGNGAFALTSKNCGSVASFAPANIPVGGGTFTVTPTGQGNCQISVTDATSGFTHSLGVTVAQYQNFTLQPGSLTFSNPAAANQSIAVSGGVGAFTVSPCSPSGVASATPGSLPVGGGNITVTPSAAGTCTVTVTDTTSKLQQTADVTVKGFTAITLSNPKLTFATPSGTPQSSTISGGDGTYSIQTGGATTCPSSSYGISGATITVNPSTIPQNTTCSIGVVDGHNNMGSLTVVVNKYAPITFGAGTTLIVPAGGSDATSINGGSGGFSTSAACASITGSTLTVSGTGCTSVTVNDSAGDVGTLGITVETSSGLTFSQNPTTPGSPVTITGGTAPYLASGCADAGGQSNFTSPPDTYMVPNDALSGHQCVITITDSLSNSGTLVVQGGSVVNIVVSPSLPIAFSSANDSPVVLHVSTTAKTRTTIFARSTDPGVAVIRPGALPGTFTVAPGPAASGTATVVFSDAAGHSTSIGVMRRPTATARPIRTGNPLPPAHLLPLPIVHPPATPIGPLALPRLAPAALTLRLGETASVAITERGYGGDYASASSGATNAALAIAGRGEAATLLVRATAVGTSTISVRDANGRVATLTLTVVAPGAVQRTIPGRPIPHIR